MASKTIEEILKNMPPESRAAIEKMSPETRKGVEQTGQGLEKQGVAEKTEYQSNAPQAKQTRSSEPQINEPVARHLENNERGAEKIRQIQAQAQQPKAAEQSKAQEKNTSDKSPENYR
ncbi:hypothetical protein [Spirosoma aerophilum]